MGDKSKLPTYDEAIAHAAARALLELPKGERWESIVAGIWHSALMWRKEQDDAAKENEHEPVGRS